MNCPTCSTPMKPLFTGEFCPNDCDRKTEAAAPTSITVNGVKLIADPNAPPGFFFIQVKDHPFLKMLPKDVP